MYLYLLVNENTNGCEEGIKTYVSSERPLTRREKQILQRALEEIHQMQHIGKGEIDNNSDVIKEAVALFEKITKTPLQFVEMKGEFRY